MSMKIKICGILHPEDAEHAARSGVDLVGMIFAPSSKRQVRLDIAKEIVSVCKHFNVTPVGVFSTQPASQIAKVCEITGIQTIQLNISRHVQLLRQLTFASVLPVVPVSTSGEVSFLSTYTTSYPLVIYDHHQGETGRPFTWGAFSPPVHPWMLAGGLNPENITEAIHLLKPHGVDVASGVEYKSSLRKDPVRVTAFIQHARATNTIE